MDTENKSSIAVMGSPQDSDGDLKSPLGADEVRLAQMGERSDLVLHLLGTFLTCST
jgi:hypothetical protein